MTLNSVRMILCAVLVLLLMAPACARRPSLDIPAGRGALRVEVTGAFQSAPSPVKGALITLTRAGRSKSIGEVTTDSTGVVVFNDLEPARYALRVRQLGYTAVRREFIVVAGKLRTERVLLEASVNCVLLSPGGLTMCGAAMAASR